MLSAQQVQFNAEVELKAEAFNAEARKFNEREVALEAELKAQVREFTAAALSIGKRALADGDDDARAKCSTWRLVRDARKKSRRKKSMSRRVKSRSRQN